ncbi:hypothetical protein O3Q51_13510 [Cryomorphaceae bacterium 1068]|nr:hypothetical protein [Cryomorphaceae bacterium 1068]
MKYIWLILLISLFSCSKESSEGPSDIKRIKVIDTDASYISRNTSFLPDGSTVTLTLPLDDSQSNDSLPSKLFRYSPEGDFIWELDLPESLNEGWKVIALADGNILVLGFSGDLFPEMAALVLISPDAQVLEEVTFTAQTRIFEFLESRRSIDGLQRQNAEIAVVVPVIPGQGQDLVPRLLRFTSSLEMISDEIYTDINASLSHPGSVFQIGIDEDDQTQIHLHGKLSPPDPDMNYFVMNITLDGETIEETNSYVTKGNIRNYPSGVASSELSRSIWCAAGNNEDAGIFSANGMDLFSVGTEISVFQTSSEADSLAATVISSFPGGGYIKTVKRTRDGGYVLLGTCNVVGDQTFPSDYRILLVKLRFDLAVEWIQSPSLGVPAIGTDILELADGYLVTCTQYTFSEINKPFLIQTDIMGQF